ncbi:ABC transporter ATP-binding protein [Cellulomonas sp. P24]|uniref:ABC transporter ATP-binding protein n=1 Tax=Cellulomonas sp. P24 TaxID=2885206 RepID=UPI00216B13ED|nr:ABC transporter ATP-binding protein [Cellulomonas sp. P24]MCR6492213.1 ABC transporter ATP-binding protein [Cellulomonas sp. P24]
MASPVPTSSTLLRLDSVTVSVSHRGQDALELVTGVTLDVREGECLAIVGESGSGKSITALAIADLLDSNMSVAGCIEYDGRELTELEPDRRRALAGQEIGFVFQDAMSALHPLMSIREQMIRPIRHHQGVSAKAAESRARDMLERVGVPRDRNVLSSYVHQLSGGLRQRVMIAMALANGPRLVIADEPTTALDAAVQGQIMELLSELRRSEDLAMILISHDISIVARHSDRVAVMYAGQIVETGPTREVINRARHPYSRALIDASPERARAPRRLPTIPGQVPALDQLPLGCRFQPRCTFAVDGCSEPQALRPQGVERLARCCNPLGGAE